MPKGKKFIDKKNATTFLLTHRSQRDPLIADETAPQSILLPLDEVPSHMGGGGMSSKSKGKTDRDLVAKKKEELKKYGIYFDDDYNYLQHLKDSKEVSQIQWDFCERIYAPQAPKAAPFEVVEDLEGGEGPSSSAKTKGDLQGVKLKLPSSVFESEYQEEIGLLNKAASSKGPRPDLDPDIVAALDEDFDYENPENQLEDDFMQLANQDNHNEDSEIIEGEPTAEDIEGLFSSDDDEEQERRHNKGGSEDDYEDEMADSVASLQGRPRYHYDDFSDEDDENKSRFTNYSMSSSVVRRNKQLLLVDDRFEKMFESYDDTEIGALDCDEIEGDINPASQLLLKYAEEFERDRKKDELVNQKVADLALRDDSDSAADDSMSEDDEDRRKEKWDCESILSTYSNTKNRPKIISEPSKKNHIRISGKTGMPVGVLGKGLTQHNLKALNSEYDAEKGVQSISRAKSLISGATSMRSKNETPEERKERKNLVKEYRRERRIERKANTEAFKDEKKRLEKVRINDKYNIPTLKL